MSKPRVITISGKATHGKDFLGDIIKEKLEEYDLRVAVIHYADRLKYIAKTYFGWDGKKDEKGRTLLQWIGTDVVREKNPEFWVNSVVEIIDLFSDSWDYVLIPDTRFPNEITRMKKLYNTTSVWIRRTDVESPLTEEQQKHPSETALDNFEFDFYGKSATGRENMTVVADGVLEHMTKRM